MLQQRREAGTAVGMPALRVRERLHRQARLEAYAARIGHRALVRLLCREHQRVGRRLGLAI